MEERQQIMERRLCEAAANNDINNLHAIVAEDPHVLKEMEKIPVANTPLHEAAEKGSTSFATEMAIMLPTLARKLNPEGLSPLHVALQAQRFETVRALLAWDPELIRVKGSGGLTALHHVARVNQHDELDLLADFLCMCGSSIDDLTSRGETAVHVAVRYGNVQAFKVLLGWLKRSDLLNVLDMKNVDGDTVLHIATSTNQREVIQLLLKRTTLFGTLCGLIKMSNVKVNAQNLNKKTALDIFEGQDEEVAQSRDEKIGRMLRRAGAKNASANADVMTLSNFLKSDLTVFEKFSRYFGIRDESTRNMILMVATLVATATYQAALSPPGGYWQEDASSNSRSSDISTSIAISALKPHKAGSMILSGSKLYRFMLLNGTAFLASIGTIWATAIGLYPDTLIVYLSITILAATYFGSINSGYPASQNYAGSVLALLYMYGILVVLFLPIMFYVRYRRLVSDVDATKRWVAYVRGSNVQN